MASGRRRRRSTQFEGAIGASPGTLAPEPDAPPPVVRVMGFGAGVLEERTLGGVAEVKEWLARFPILWVNVDGLGDVKALKELGALFSVHELALEDVLAVHHRAKLETWGDRRFLVIRMPEIAADGRVGTDQLSVFWGEGFVLTFQQNHGDCFDPVRTRIRQQSGGRIRTSGADYVVYALLDAVIDSYYPVLERRGDVLEDLEDAAIDRPTRRLVARIHDVRRDLLVLRRAMWPLREILTELLRDEDAKPELRPFLRDCYDHVIELVDLVETYRDLAAGVMEMYISSVSNRMNEIMKVLTIIATIFIPLTFVAGVYGMNFDFMPELRWRYGYPAALAAMAVVAVLLLVWFRRMGWIGSFRRPAAAPPRD